MEITDCTRRSFCNFVLTENLGNMSNEQKYELKIKYIFFLIL